ncbi:MAG TPA: response regulator [Armatimonadota bacterium]|nr:response regulator [Armatimonadota bacterium]
MPHILVIDDEEEVRTAVARRLRRESYRVDDAGSQAEGRDKIANAPQPYDVVVTDMLMEQQESGIAMLEAALSRDLFTEVIVLTAYGSVANAVECMKRGAFDYVEKSIPGVDVYDLLTMKVEKALDARRNALRALRRLEESGRLAHPESDFV